MADDNDQADKYGTKIPVGTQCDTLSSPNGDKITKMRTIKNNRRGQVTTVALGIVVGLVFLAVVLPVGLSIWQSISGTITQANWSEAANTSMTNVTTNIGSGFSLLAIAPLILAAGGIIALLVVAFMRMRGD